MGKNKVVYGSSVLIDLTEDTVTSNDLAVGVTAHDASGDPISGSLKEHNLVAANISELNSETAFFENGSFRIGATPTMSGENVTNTTAYKRGIVKTDSLVGIVGNSSIFGNAAASNVEQGKTFTSANGYVVSGSMVVQNYYSGTSTPASSLGSDGDIYFKL